MGEFLTRLRRALNFALIGFKAGWRGDAFTLNTSARAPEEQIATVIDAERFRVQIVRNDYTQVVYLGSSAGGALRIFENVDTKGGVVELWDRDVRRGVR